MRAIPPPLWALIALAATWGLSLAPPLNTLAAMAGARPFGLGIIILALALMFAAMAQFKHADTQLLPNSPTNNALVTGGLFAFTRNPMYLGMVLFFAGAALWMERWVMLAAPFLMFAVANGVFIPFEEAKMRRQFGDSFDAYRRRVRRWI